MTMEEDEGAGGAGMDPTLMAFVGLQETVRQQGAATDERLKQALAKLDGLASRPAGGGGANVAIPQDLENLGHRLDAQTQGLERVGERLSDYVASGRGRIEQNRRLWQVGGGGVGIGIVVGLALLLGLARFLPYGLDTRLAAMVVGEDRWSAAAALMADADFERYVLGYGAREMARRNSARLEPCVEAALASGEAQACTLRVLAPGQYYQQGLERPADDAAP